MKLISMLLLFSVSTWNTFSLRAQKNDDTFLADYRKKNESLLKLGDKEMRKEIAAFTMKGVEEAVGQITLNKITPVKTKDSSVTFEAPNLQVKIWVTMFLPYKHKIDKDENDRVVKIDKKGYYGDYGKMPKIQIQSVQVVLGKDTVAIPAAAYTDLYNINFYYKDKEGTERTTNAIYRTDDNKKVYIYLLCKDNSGSYEVTWIIKDKKYIRRVLDYDLF